MSDFEKPGSYYIGKAVDPNTGEPTDEYILYDARDLTTHAVCVGMTGSGKTGLCVDILEEAALNGVPTIMIDPKGDITNLLLTFPELRPEDFLPWVNPDDARRKGLSLEEFAQKTAQTWRDGLAQWGQEPERIQRLKEAAEFIIFTPGSDSGQPVSILQTLKAPQLSWDTDQETLREMISGTVSALLGLVGIQADPLRSREHILLSSLFEHAWRKGQDLDLGQLILQVQKPPVGKLGVFDVDTFFPEKDRFELSMAFNAILAAPSFQTWIQGTPLDIDVLLHGEGGKPRASIFYIAHLSDAERMFFVSLLLEQVRTWVRRQSGTTSLRALVYFDEVFGYFPPHPANPPSKGPLLALLKQARAFGLGVILVTQNPVDLDYKGLTNAGTWFIGKLQTENDKNRVLEGMEGAIQSSGLSVDRGVLDKTISGLKSRVFLMHNVHESGPKLMMTRWAMSYLRGPLTKTQIQTLMADRKQPVTATPSVVATGSAPSTAPPAASPSALMGPPPLPSDVPQYFLPVNLSTERAYHAVQQQVGRPVTVLSRKLLYEPMLLGSAVVHFVDRKTGISTEQRWTRLVSPPEGPALLRWDESEEITLDPKDLSARGADDALYADLPPGLNTAKSLANFAKDFAEYLYRNARLSVWQNATLKLFANLEETEADFWARCRRAADGAYEKEADAIRKKYEAKFKRLDDALAKEKLELLKDEAELGARKQDEILSAGAGLLGLFTRRKLSTTVSAAARKRGLTAKAQAEVEESKQAIAQMEKEKEQLQSELQAELDALRKTWDEAAEQISQAEISPNKTDIVVQMFGIGWRPIWEIGYDDSQGREIKVRVPAFGGAPLSHFAQPHV